MHTLRFDGCQPTPLRGERITVGRTSENDIQLDDPSISSHHASFQLRDGQYVLKDLGSTNGTEVNGQRITETVLGNNDRLRFGTIEATYCREAAAAGEGQATPHNDVSIEAEQPTAAPSTHAPKKWSFKAAIIVAAALTVSVTLFFAYTAMHPTPEAVVRKYLAAEQWQDRLKYVENPQTVEPLMKDFYKEGYHGPVKFESMAKADDGPGGEKRIKVVFGKTTAGIFTRVDESIYWIIPTPQGPKVDWTASSLYQPMSWAAYRSKRPITPFKFRVIASLSDTYYAGFDDRQTWIAVDLVDPHESADLVGYARRSSQIGHDLFESLKDGRSHEFILNLRFPDRDGTGRGVEILKPVIRGLREPPLPQSQKPDLFDLDRLTQVMVKGKQPHERNDDNLILFHQPGMVPYADQRMFYFGKSDDSYVATLYCRDSVELATIGAFVKSGLFTDREADQLFALLDNLNTHREAEIGRFDVELQPLGSVSSKRTIFAVFKRATQTSAPK